MLGINTADEPVPDNRFVFPAFIVFEVLKYK